MQCGELPCHIAKRARTHTHHNPLLNVSVRSWTQHQTQQSVQDGVCKRWAESQDLDDFRCGPMREKCSKFCRKWMVNMPSFEIPNPPTMNLDLPNLDLSLDLDLPWWGIDVPTCASATGTDCDLPSFPNVRFPDFPELPEFTLPTLPLPKIPALHVQTSFVQKAEFKHMMEPPECEDYKHELEVMISTAGHTGCYDFWGNPCNGVAFSQCPGRICKRWRPVCGWSCFGYSGSALTREEDDGCYSQWKQAPLCYEPRAPETVPPPPPPAVTLEDYCYSCAQCDSATYPAEGSYLVHQITIFDSTRMCDRNYGVNQGGTCTGSRDVDWATVFSGSPYPHMATSYPISLKEAFCRQCQVLRGHQPVLRDHIGTDSGAAGMSIRSAPTDHVAQGICKKQDYNTCSSHIPEHALTAWHRACPLLDPANYDSYGFPKSANFEERLKDALFKQKMKTYQEAELGVLLKMTPSYPTCTYDASSDTDGPFVTQTGGGHLSECKYPGMCCHSQFREFEVDHHVIGKRWTPRTGQYGYYCKLPPFYVHPHLFSPIPENAAEGDFKCQKCVEDYEPCPFAANNANPCCNPRSSYQFDGPNKGLCADSTCVAPVPQLKGRPFARDIKEIVLEPHKCTFANFARGWTNADSEVAGIVQGDCCGTSTCRPANHFRIAPHVCIACAEEGQECAYKYTDGWEKFHQFADCCDPAANVCTHVGDGKHTCQQSHDVRNPTFD